MAARVAGVTKRFGGFVAVDDVSLDIARGEFLALLGPSGCGKTTLLRILSGLEAPDAGRIFLEDQDVTAVPPYRRAVNMMFQSYALFPHLTVAGNVAFGLRQEKRGRREIKERVADALALVQLSELGQRKPHQLSGGQRQRVALARCLVKRPTLLLLDEPLAALDKKLREETQFELMAIQRRVGITFVIVTHDQQEAMTMASRIAVMREGRIVQLGTPSEIYEAPGSRYVAEFIGDINIFEGHATRVGADRVEIGVDGAAGMFVAGGARNGLAAGDRLWIAVRPEDITLTEATEATETPGEAAPNRLAGEISEIAYLGNLSTYRVRLAGGQLVTATSANRRGAPLRPHGRVALSWPPEASILLRS